MPDPRDDPRLTAYALGELDAAEVSAVEAEFVGRTEALAWVEEVRVTARLLATQLRTEQGPRTSPPDRTWLESRLSARPRRRRWLRPAMAAGLLGLIGSTAWLVVPRSVEPAGARLIARNDPAPLGVERAKRSPSTKDPVREIFTEVGSPSPVATEGLADDREAPASPASESFATDHGDVAKSLDSGPPAKSARQPQAATPPTDFQAVDSAKRELANQGPGLVSKAGKPARARRQFGMGSNPEPLALPLNGPGYSRELIERTLETGTEAARRELDLNRLLDSLPSAEERVVAPDPVTAELEVVLCPWNLDHRLARVTIAWDNIPVGLAASIRSDPGGTPSYAPIFELADPTPPPARDESGTGTRKADPGLPQGHSRTRLYEVVPRPGRSDHANLVELTISWARAGVGEPPILLKQGADSTRTIGEASADFRFSAAVAGIVMAWRGDSRSAGFSPESALDLASGAVGPDPSGRRRVFVEQCRRILATGRK